MKVYGCAETGMFRSPYITMPAVGPVVGAVKLIVLPASTYIVALGFAPVAGKYQCHAAVSGQRGIGHRKGVRDLTIQNIDAGIYCHIDAGNSYPVTINAGI